MADEYPVVDENTIGYKDCGGPHDQIQFSDANWTAPSLVFRGIAADYIFMIKPDGSIELGPQASLDDASRAFWNYICQTNPFLDATRKQGLRDWLQQKRAMDGRDLYAGELLDELARLLEA